MQIIVIQEKAKYTNHISIADSVPAENIEKMLEEMENNGAMDDIHDIHFIAKKYGVEIAEPIDSEGCYEDSEFECYDWC